METGWGRADPAAGVAGAWAEAAAEAAGEDEWAARLRPGRAADACARNAGIPRGMSSASRAIRRRARDVERP